MDATTATIADFTASLSASDLPDAVVRETRRRMVDSMGCLIGGLRSDPAAIARSLAGEVTGTLGATAAGLARPTTIEMAAFTNSIMVRYLDFNDTYYGPRGGGGHPSDLLPAALALGEALGLSGREVMLLTVIGYEVFSRLAATVKLRERGWDQGLYTGLAAAMMAGRALGLDHARLGNAAALALIPHVPTRQTRAGELSMWKGAATAEGVRCGIFAAQLAQRGMTGPTRPFEGEDGIWDRVSGPFTLSMPRRPDTYAIQQVHTKYRPAEFNAQALLDLAVALQPELDLARVRALHVETYWLGYSEIGSEPAKWDPQVRETADHSIPYLLGRALTDGELGTGSFTPERVLDPGLRPLMEMITVSENPAYTARFPAELPVRLTVTLDSGEQIERAAQYPRGHTRNPMTDDEFDRKFDDLMASDDPANAIHWNEIRKQLWHLEDIDDVSGLVRLLGLVSAG